MKELSIEEKAKRYYKAYEMAKKLKETCDSNAIVGWMEYIFPELAESEDEKIRKDLINYLRSILSNKKYGDKFIEDWIAWLEKRGEQKKELLQELDDNLNNALENETSESLGKFLNEQKPVDKIQIGKKYKCIASPRYTTFMVGEIYKPEDRFLCSLMNFCSACFKSIEDDEQKPDNIECKYSPCYNMSFEEAQEYISNRGFDIPWTDCDVFVDFRYVTQTIANILCWADNNPKQNPAWSEEDEKMLNDILMCCEHHCYLDAGNIDWLKSLRPQNRWKPSDEQMYILNWVTNLLNDGIVEKHAKGILESLYSDLKKLK